MVVSKGTVVVNKRLALLVDERDSNQKYLQDLLVVEGYQAIFAKTCSQAMRLFLEQSPDMVFITDVIPAQLVQAFIADIKGLPNADFVPVILLTKSGEDAGLQNCANIGADDYLINPVTQVCLRSQLNRMERIRDLTLKVTDLQQTIKLHHHRLFNEQIIAEQIYNRAVTGENINSEHIQQLIRAVSIFSGDLLLSAYRPDGTLHVLHGDFTGHGLTAAVGVLPAAEVFRAMTAKGFSSRNILDSINKKLHRLLPTGMFMAACFVTVDKNLRSMTIWNAGMPEVLVLAPSFTNADKLIIKHKIASRYLALGILEAIDHEAETTHLSISSGDRILLSSDGVTEACNFAGEEFGRIRYEEAATSTVNSFQSVISALEKFCAGNQFSDDVSILEIHCVSGLHPEEENQDISQV